MLEFNIQEAPPTIDEINQEREDLSAQYRRAKTYAQLPAVVAVAAVAMILVVCLFGFFATQHPGGIIALYSLAFQENTLALALLGAVVVALIGFVSALHLNANLGEVKVKIFGLKEVVPSHKDSAKLLEACQGDPDCSRYNLALVKQGRRPVVAEKKALIAWPESAEDRRAEQLLQSGVDLHREAARKRGSLG